MDNLSPEELNQFEPAFLSLITANTEEILSFPEQLTSKILSYCDREVARDPLNLANHSRRVALYVKQGDMSGAYSAILDLFSVEKGGAKLVRTKAALLLAKELFSCAEYAALSDAIDLGDLQVLPLPKKAVLAKGFEIGLPLVKQGE